MTSACTVIIGASSGIARACAEEWASAGHPLVLAGRRIDDLERTAADLRVRFQVSVDVRHWDAGDASSSINLAASLAASKSPVGILLVAHGWMVEQSQASADPAVARRMIDINLTSVIDVVERCIPVMPTDGSACIALISSVAGDRGRQSNYIYGAAKAGLTVYAQGLRNRLFHHRIHVLTIKPGFVATPMTAGKVRFDSPLMAQPIQVARDIAAAVRGRRNVIYTRWFWRWIMAVITSIPEPLFKRLRL